MSWEGTAGLFACVTLCQLRGLGILCHMPYKLHLSSLLSFSHPGAQHIGGPWEVCNDDDLGLISFHPRVSEVRSE